MRRRRPSADPSTPPNDWQARADQERLHRDAAWRQRQIEMTRQAAAREAWRPQVDGVNHPQRGLARHARPLMVEAGAPQQGRALARRCRRLAAGRPAASEAAMTARPVPRRHWRSYGEDPLPTGAEALDEPFAAFPSWFMRITCDRCGKDRMVNEAHTAHRNLPIRTILAKMHHDGCGGRAGRVELLTGIEGASSRPVRKIVLLG